MVVKVSSVRRHCHRESLSCSHSHSFVLVGNRNQRTSRGYEKPSREDVSQRFRHKKNHRKKMMLNQRSQRQNHIRNQRLQLEQLRNRNQRLQLEQLRNRNLQEQR